MEKTGIKIEGLLWNISVYEGEKGRYTSFDLAVQGHRQMVNVKLPSGYPVEQYSQGEVVSMPVLYKTTKFGNFFEAIV